MIQMLPLFERSSRLNPNHCTTSPAKPKGPHLNLPPGHTNPLGRSKALAERRLIHTKGPGAQAHCSVPYECVQYSHGRDTRKQLPCHALKTRARRSPQRAISSPPDAGAAVSIAHIALQ